jgi:fructose-1-phosphate kinase PfkB-like protein
VSLFLSDVETDTWSQQQLDAVAGSCDRVIITLGEKGALLLHNGSSSTPQHIPVVKVKSALSGRGPKCMHHKKVSKRSRSLLLLYAV